MNPPRKAIFLCLLLSAFCSLSGISHADSQAIPAELKGIGIDQNLNHQVPLDLPFTDETGKRVFLSDYLGTRPALLVLAYYECPRLCTLVLNGVAKSLKRISLQMGKDYQVITVSINPKETFQLAAAKKASYLQVLGDRAHPEGWHFLTGTQDSITRLANAVGYHYKLNPQTHQFDHASGIMVLTPGGKLSRYFYGIDYPAQDLRLSLVEASGGKIGSKVDELLLYCCSFDPTTGKYNLVIFRVVQVIGTGIALALAIFLLIMFRTDRWRNRGKPLEA